ncbi:DUF11 domain-containing protein [Chloroflexi bacterium TSY]|nr:DUF11 domain-containing protein [Chloroflexi bacterium TSY]
MDIAVKAQTEPDHQTGRALSGVVESHRQIDVQSIRPVVQERGKISLSVDGLGTNNPSGGIIQVEKPASATVRGAYLAAASTGTSERRLLNGDVRIDGEAVNWVQSLPSNIRSYNHWADVTALVKTKIDNAPSGRVNFRITEVDTENIDGEVLAVIFDDPNQTTDNTIFLLFGAQNVSGDTFSMRWTDPIDKNDSTLVADMALGISFGCQIAFNCVGVQYSQIDVNGRRMTTAAGGQDDGENSNGTLLTVGGLGDSTANPANPFALPSGSIRVDDELYDMLPFMTNGDTTLRVDTLNPSNDDNIFFASFFLAATTAVIGESVLLTPTSASNHLGANHSITAIVQDDNGNPVTGRTVSLRVLTGPNAGTTRSGITNANGRVTISYTGRTAGTDVIEATIVDSQGETNVSNRVTAQWVQQILPDDLPDLDAVSDCVLLADADGDSVITPGDTIHCTVVASNLGSVMAMSAVYRNNLGPYLILIAGSVTTTQGSVINGNSSGDRTILVTIGNIMPNGSVVITFDVQISSSLPPGRRAIPLPGTFGCDDHPEIRTRPRGSVPGTPIITIGPYPALRAVKESNLAIDLNGDNIAGAGDTVEYVATLINSGNATAPTVGFADQLDPNTTLIVGSVRTTQGQVILGNRPGDTTVEVHAGPLDPGESLTIRFQVRVNPNLSETVYRLANLAVCFYPEAPDQCVGRTTGGLCEPTETPTRPEPLLSATKRGSLFIDADGDGLPSPKDTLLYRVVIENRGSAAATEVGVTDPLDPNTTLVPGSVRFNQGSLVQGDSIDDRTIEIIIGTLKPNQRILISFLVTINDSLPAGVTAIRNQCTVRSNELSNIISDDPGTPAPRDMSEIRLDGRPDLQVTKMGFLINDVGVPQASVGDTILYQATIANVGGGAATSVRFEDTLDSATTLVVDSLRTSRGNETVDTKSANTIIRVDIGRLDPGETVSISFRVIINKGATGNQIHNQARCIYDDPDSDGTLTVLSDNPGTSVANDPIRFSLVSGFFLPFISKSSACDPNTQRPADVLLVLDRSGSMSVEGKLDAAKVAASVFLDQMALSGEEQAGIASFADTARLETMLTRNGTDLLQALASLSIRNGTALGDGIAVAQEELQSPRHNPNHTPVMIVLSDGFNSTGRAPLSAAAQAKTAGTRIFTIGLGSNVDETTLRQIASNATDYKFAPGPEDLAAIYREIAGEVNCQLQSQTE